MLVIQPLAAATCGRRRFSPPGCHPFTSRGCQSVTGRRKALLFMDTEEITLKEIEEANELIKGIPVVEIQPPATQLIRNDRGDYYRGESPAWIKLSTAFRDDLSKLKGCKLAVFICACLHISERGDSFPAMRTICNETGYELAAVGRAIRELESMGMMKVDRRRGEVNHYRPVFAAYGASTPQKRRPVPPKSEVVPPIKSEHEVEPIKKNQEEESHAPKARARSVIEVEVERLMVVFTSETNIPIRKMASQAEITKLWRNPMRDIIALSNGQSEWLLKETIHHMRAQNPALTIKTPNSLLGCAPDVWSRYRPPQNNVRIDPMQPYWDMLAEQERTNAAQNIDAQ